MKIDDIRIGDIVGADNVSIKPETCMVYSKDVTSLPDLAFQIISKSFDVVTQPVDVLSLQNLIWYAVDNKIPLVPRGNGTSGWGGAIPTRAGICVDLSEMNKILYFNEQESAVTVEPGLTWRDLLSFLERLGFTLPVYPSSATAATVGGFVASGGLGIGSARNGDILKQVIGIEAVLPNGKIVRLGRVLLNPQEDDLQEKTKEGNQWLNQVLSEVGLGTPEQESKLITGTYGTLGIITKVTLKTLPNLQLVPFACSFNNMEDLVNVASKILSDIQPYFLRFLADNYTSKLWALKENELEFGKYILTGSLLDTIYQNEDNIEIIKTLAREGRGIVLEDNRAWYYWSERLYPLRIKRHGPSLVPAEMLAQVDMLTQILKKTKNELKKSRVAIEGTFNNDGKSSFMVWILDDERKKISYTIGWYRSFQIASLAERFGGLPYAVGLWNGRHAEKYYGSESYHILKRMKKKLDPQNLMNPVKVFGGRVTAGRASMLTGFTAGFAIVLFALTLGLNLLGLTSVIQFMNSSFLPLLAIPNFILLSVLGGVMGTVLIKLMTLNQALAVGIPMLRLLSKILRK
ncbi:MAG: FAD-binding oxidoreductase [Candidatus Thorarchaeota archaeon]|nr:MAG: FAD-binding oxidoreductase [Candidatus Thorarchaeota archaeon]